MAKSRVDVTLCQHGKFPAALLLKFFVLYYKRNFNNIFRVDIQLYQQVYCELFQQVVTSLQMASCNKLDFNRLVAT